MGKIGLAKVGLNLAADFLPMILDHDEVKLSFDRGLQKEGSSLFLSSSTRTDLRSDGSHRSSSSCLTPLRSLPAQNLSEASAEPTI